MSTLINNVDNKDSNENIMTNMDRLKRSSYLSSKGIRANDPAQLSMIFEGSLGLNDDARSIPNDYARSSLFSARNKNVPRRIMHREKLFHYNEHVTIIYTGIELRAEDDEIVWMQILKYGERVTLGVPFEFSLKDLVADVGWHKNGRSYDRVRECISRLKANEVLAQNSKAYGKSGAVSLIQNYTTLNDDNGSPTYYKVWIDPNLIVLFAGKTFTSHRWVAYRTLSPVARKLADYIESHKQPFNLGLDTFKCLCNSNDQNVRSWRQTTKKACAEVQESGIVKSISLDDNDQICCVRE